MRRLLPLLLLFACPLPVAAAGEPVPVGGPIPVADGATYADVAMDDMGRFLVVWTAATVVIIGQRFDSDGRQLGDLLGLSVPIDFQVVYRVAMSGAGDFAIEFGIPSLGVAGLEESWGVHQFSPDGTMRSTPYTGVAAIPLRDLSMNSAGEFVIVWLEEFELESFRLRAQLFDSDGVPIVDPIVVAESTASEDIPRWPAAAIDDLGNFVIAWQAYTADPENGTPLEQYANARRYSSEGLPLGAAFRVDSSTNEPQLALSVAADATGNFVVAWNQRQGNSSNYVMARRFDSSGLALGGSFPVSTTPLDPTYFQPDLAMNEAGDFVIVWTSEPPGPTSPGSIGGLVRARAFRSDGSSEGSEFPVAGDMSLRQYNARVARGQGDAFVIVWADISIYGIQMLAQRFVPDGFEFGSESFDDLPLQNDAAGFVTPNGLFFAVRDAQNDAVATLGGNLAESTGIAEETGNQFWHLQSRAGTITVTAEPIMTGLLPGEDATSGSFLDSLAEQPDLMNAEIRVSLRASPVAPAARAGGTPGCDPLGRLLLGDVEGNVFATDPFEIEPTFTEVSKHAREFDVPVGAAPSIDLSAISQLGFDLLVTCESPTAFELGIDDVSVVAAVPAPSTTAAAAAVLGGMGLLARRRRSAIDTL